MGEIFRWEQPAERLPFTGERFTSQASGQIEIEHLHRYFLAREISRGKDVLDIASGEGYGAALLAQVARSVVGVERDAEAATHAARAYERSNLRFVQGDARAIPLKTASVDIVVSFETIEHLYEQTEFIAEVQRILRPDGIFIVSTPDRDVYSPTDSPANPFHVRELTIPEFDSALRRFFGHVDLMLQRPLLGSVLLPHLDVSGTEPVLTFERRGDEHFESSVGLPRAVYAVAFASAKPVRLPAASVYIETSGVGLRLDALTRSQETNERLERTLAEVKSDNSRLEALLERARADNERLEALFGTARSETERLEGLFATARSENERLEALFGTARSENERLEGLFAAARSENARLEALFGTARSENERLERLFATARSENERLEKLFGEARSENGRLEGLLETSRFENERLETLVGEMRAEHQRVEKLHAEALSELQRLTSQVSDIEAARQAELADLKSALVRAESEREDALRSLAETSAHLHRIETGICWRALAPVRRASRWARRLIETN